MGTKLNIAALGLLCLFYQAKALMLSCKEYDTRLIRKKVLIESVVGRDGKWVTKAQAIRIYANETLKKNIKINFDVTECGRMAVVFPIKQIPDDNALAGSDIILIDRPKPTSFGNEDSDIISSNLVDQGGVKGKYSNLRPKPVSNGKDTLRIYSRREWGAEDLSHEMTKLYQNIPSEIIIGDTQSGTCSSLEECAMILRSRQHRSSYGLFVNFMVGNNGMIFEGRGWDHESGRKNTFIIDVIGSYMQGYPPESEMRAVRKVIDYGVKNGKIAKNYKLKMAKDIGWGVK